MSLDLPGLRNLLTLLFIAFLSVFFFCSSSFAETRYVIDILVVDVRDSMNSQYKKIANVKTGEAVEVLEETSRFVKVKTSKGDVGYIAKQYVSPDIPKAKVIANLQYEIKNLKR